MARTAQTRIKALERTLSGTTDPASQKRLQDQIASLKATPTAQISSKTQAVQPAPAATPVAPEAPVPVQTAPTLLEGQIDPRLAAQGDLVGAAQAQEEFLGESITPTTFEGLVAQQKAKQLKTREAQEAGFARSQEQFDITSDQQGRSVRGAFDAAETQLVGGGREGMISAGNVLATQQLKGILGERIRTIQIQREGLNAEIDSLRTNLKQAQDANNAQLVQDIQSTIAAKELEIRSADTDYINSLTAQVEQDAKIRESEVNMMTTKGETVRESLAGLGIMAGELGIDQLTAMTQGTDITLPEALLLQQASVLSGKVDMAKNEVDQAKAMADLEKVMLELDNFGKSDAVQEFEYYSQLSDEGKRNFLEFQSSAVNSQLVKGEDGSIYAFDPASSTLQVLSSAGDGQVGSFENAVPPEDITSVVNSSIGKGRVTGYGSSAWSQGLDFFLEGGKGAPVSLPFSFEVTEIDEGSTGFGNRVKVKNTADGKEMWISHLDGFGNIQEGQTYTPNTVIGAQGNTGTVIDLGGGGVHLDITMPKEEGGYYSPQQVASYLGVSDVSTYSDPFLQDLEESKGGSRVLSDQLKGLEKSFQAVNQLEMLSSAMDLDQLDTEFGGIIDTSPISGWLAERNPWNKDAQEVKAILTATVPTVARGVFGEVGVLTDQDVALYTQTLPNLQQTDQVKKLVTAALLKTVQNGVKDKLEILANTGYDVSGLADKYQRLETQVKQMESELGISSDPDPLGLGIGGGSGSDPLGINQ